MPRKIQPGPAPIEEEELDTEVRAVETEMSPDAMPLPPDPARSGSERPLALFAIGALIIVAGLGLLITGFTQDHYAVDVRNGPQPDGDTDTSDRIVIRIGLDEILFLRYDDGTGDPNRETRGWDDAPVVGILMKRLAWTGYIGAGLLGLAFLAGVLHRFGALTVSGPAPMMAVFGVVALTAGALPFFLEIAHHARIDMIPGRLDIPPAFWTENADGDFVHDLYMHPLAGFWFHTAGIVAVAVGAVLLFWPQILGMGRGLQRFAESAAPQIE